MDSKIQRDVFDRYGSIYENILGNIYPAKNSTGFPERNLSVNFSKAYEDYAKRQNEAAFSWFEFQFGKSNNLHVDAIIINKTQKDMLIVESKRFSNPQSKISEISKDIVRVHDLVDELQKENANGIYRIPMNRIKHCYGVVLADVWTETALKIDILNSYKAGEFHPTAEDSFLKKYCNGILSEDVLDSVFYNIIKIDEISDEKNSYNLVSFLWKIF